MRFPYEPMLSPGAAAPGVRLGKIDVGAGGVGAGGVGADVGVVSHLDSSFHPLSRFAVSLAVRLA
jgi:hypothetical protein